MIVQVARREDDGFTVLICDGGNVIGGWRVAKVWVDESEVSDDSPLIYVDATEVMLTKKGIVILTSSSRNHDDVTYVRKPL